MNNLEKIIKYALSRPPSSAGRRIRSERDLAALLKANHSKVRKALSELVHKGVLVRRHGSGTYVRKVPKISYSHVPHKLKIPSESLFASDQLEQDYAPHLEPTKQQQLLYLSLWADLEPDQMASRRALIRGIMRQTERAGHFMSMHSVCGNDGKVMAVSELAQQLKNNPSDGYLVGSWSADLFLKAIGKTLKPIVYFSDSNRPIKNDPTVMLDSLEAICRGVNLLAEQGYKRIGMIGLDLPYDPLESTEPSRKAYERAMLDVGLNYYTADFCQATVTESMAAIRRLLSSSDPPEAVLIADDIVLNGVAKALTIDGIVPGQDIAVITLSNVNSKLPKGFAWSRLEFDVEGLGEQIVDTLLSLLLTAGRRANSSAAYVKWRPGKTHLLRKETSQ